MDAELNPESFQLTGKKDTTYGEELVKVLGLRSTHLQKRRLVALIYS